MMSLSLGDSWPESWHELGDGHALVAHPLDAAGDVQQRRDDPQISRDRRLACEHREDALLNPQRALVDSFAVGDRDACQFDVLVDDRLHHSVERPDHQLEATESLMLEFG